VGPRTLAEFIAIGTAVKHRDGVLHRAPNGRPFTSDLSGQDFWTLLRTGHRPVGMVMGSCVYHVAHRGMLQSMAQTGRNVELPNFTQALYDARELAMERMQSEAQTLSAEGIVVDLQEKARLGQPHDRVLRGRRRSWRARPTIRSKRHPVLDLSSECPFSGRFGQRRSLCSVEPVPAGDRGDPG
jgi:uncharacterized protein YbjQ (UPF0145 family)